MRLGLFVGYWPWFELEEQVALAVLADERGFDSVWIAESYGQDAVAMLALLAQRTKHAALGAAVHQIPARQPTTMAMAAATLDRISGGRIRLGLGLSGPQVSEGFYGVPYGRPIARAREYVEIVRRTLRGTPVDYEGRHWSIPLRHGGVGLGKPLKLLGGPVQKEIPIYLGVLGPRAVEQAGRIADGWLPFFFSPEHAESITAPLRRGIEQAGRRRQDVVIAAVVPVAVADDVDAARDLVRPYVAFYLGGMGARSRNDYLDLAARCGHGPSAVACQERFLAGDRRGAAAALTNELIDAVSLAATPSTLAPRVAAYAAAGVDLLIVTPFGDRAAVLDRLAPLQDGTRASAYGGGAREGSNA